MTVSAKRLTIWTDAPRRTGLHWVFCNALVVLRLIRNNLLARFIGFLGTLCVPGVKPVGALQAGALRLMGARCASNEVWIGPNFRVDYPNNLSVGKRVVIGADTRITARDEIVIGDDFLAAPGLYLNTGTHDPATLVPQSSPIVIDPGVWCGARVTVCSGVKIGAGAIIGAGSLVLRDIPPEHLAHGVPCRPQRSIEPLRRNQVLWSNFRRKKGGQP